jgi:energy-coupling factor transporter ATP-binding protein EcfA2
MWQLAERAGLVFQNPAAQMLAQSVEEEVIFGLENLGLPRNVIRERLESTLEQFGLGSLRRRSPQTLSGGEQQKLALVATMARHPTVLVMDEPLSMLDGTAANELVEHATDLADAGATVIVCEHREEYLEAVPGLCKVNLDGLVLEEVAIPELEPHLFGPQVDKLEVQGLTCSAGRVAGRADAESVEASWLFRLSG